MAISFRNIPPPSYSDPVSRSNTFTPDKTDMSQDTIRTIKLLSKALCLSTDCPSPPVTQKNRVDIQALFERALKGKCESLGKKMLCSTLALELVELVSLFNDETMRPIRVKGFEFNHLGREKLERRGGAQANRIARNSRIYEEPVELVPPE